MGDLKHMAEEYRANAGLMLQRIKELKRQLSRTDRKTGEWTRLKGRINALETIYAENIRTAVFLENYHGN
nr:MAG TPA: Potassium voltage-gated channel subfamily KQT channel, KCNQ1, CaM, MEMBRANE.1A [Caudoviricetes sp.]